MYSVNHNSDTTLLFWCPCRRGRHISLLFIPTHHATVGCFGDEFSCSFNDVKGRIIYIHTGMHAIASSHFSQHAHVCENGTFGTADKFLEPPTSDHFFTRSHNSYFLSYQNNDEGWVGLKSKAAWYHTSQ